MTGQIDTALKAIQLLMGHDATLRAASPHIAEAVKDLSAAFKDLHAANNAVDPPIDDTVYPFYIYQGLRGHDLTYITEVQAENEDDARAFFHEEYGDNYGKNITIVDGM